MIRHLLVFFLFLSTLGLQAQVTLSLSPEVIELDVDESENMTIAHSWLVNTSDEAKVYRWVRRIESKTDGWDVLICDFNSCWNSTIDSSITDLEMEPGDTSNLDVHIEPHLIEGSAHVKLVVFEVANPDNKIEGNYYFNQSVSSRTSSKVSDIKIFPNPARDYFQLSSYDDVDQVIIYNMAGAEIKSLPSHQEKKFDISELNRGLYLVRMVDRRGAVLKALRLNKR